MFKLRYGPYSPSRLDTALCPDTFYTQYVDPNRDKNKKVEHLPQARGSVVHEVLECITKKLREKPDTVFDRENLRQLVEASIANHKAAVPDTADILKMTYLYVTKPPALLTSDAETELKLATKWSDGKQEFIECDYDDPDAFGRGRADILVISDDTTSAIIYDHKTQPNYEDADTFQLGFYAWVVSKIYPFLNEIKTILHLARYGSYMEYTWTKEDLNQIQDVIITRVNVIENTQEWVPVPNSKCQYCPKLITCSIWKGFIEVLPDGTIVTKLDNFEIFDTNKAVFVAGLITVMEECLKILKPKLKTYVENTGPIAIPGKVYEFRGEDQIHWDKVNKYLKNDVYKLCEKYKIDPRQHMGFSQTATSAIWFTENKDFIAELSQLLPRKAYVEFRGFKI